MVEFVIDLDVFWNDGLELREAGFHFVDDAQRRGVGALRYGNIDRAASIDFGKASDDVARIFNRADVPQKNSRARSCANRKVLQVLDIRDHRIDGRETQQISGAHIPRRHYRVPGVQRLDHFLWGHPVSAKTIRVDAHDNRSRRPSEWRRS